MGRDSRPGAKMSIALITAGLYWVLLGTRAALDLVGMHNTTADFWTAMGMSTAAFAAVTMLLLAWGDERARLVRLSEKVGQLESELKDIRS